LKKKSVDITISYSSWIFTV